MRKCSKSFNMSMYSKFYPGGRYGSQWQSCLVRGIPKVWEIQKCYTFQRLRYGHFQLKWIPNCDNNNRYPQIHWISNKRNAHWGLQTAGFLQVTSCWQPMYSPPTYPLCFSRDWLIYRNSSGLNEWWLGRFLYWESLQTRSSNINS